MKKTRNSFLRSDLRSERAAYAALAREAGAAEVRRGPDGTLQFCGRSGPLAEPVEYDDGWQPTPCQQQQAQHTPGPWETDRGAYVHQIGGGTVARAYAGGAAARTKEGKAEEEANARLIAAAPELYAALRECEKELRLLNVTLNGEQRPNTTMARAIETARAALAKVEG